MFQIVCNEMSCTFMNGFTKNLFHVNLFVLGICKWCCISRIVWAGDCCFAGQELPAFSEGQSFVAMLTTNILFTPLRPSCLIVFLTLGITFQLFKI
jgi:hypothetical protein